MFRNVTILLSLVAVLFAPIALAKEGSSKDKAESAIVEILADRNLDKATRFVVNNTLFTMYHEVGHLLVDQMVWPVLSREEDVADNFATYILLNKSRRAIELALKDSALGWKLEDAAYGGGARRHISAYYDEHSLNIQRAYQIVCLMVGKDRASFHDVARDWGIDRERQARCSDDYDQIERAFVSVIDRGANKDTEAKIEVRYELAGEYLDLAYKTLRDSQILESVAADLRRGYGLTRPVQIVAQRCDEPNAFYDPSQVKIIMCYELVDDYFDMINKHLASISNN